MYIRYGCGTGLLVMIAVPCCCCYLQQEQQYDDDWNDTQNIYVTSNRYRIRSGTGLLGMIAVQFKWKSTRVFNNKYKYKNISYQS